jgi:hypothetical protein
VKSVLGSVREEMYVLRIALRHEHRDQHVLVRLTRTDVPMGSTELMGYWRLDKLVEMKRSLWI